MTEKAETIGETYLNYADSFFSFLANPKGRLFIVYLLSSVFIAYLVFRKSKSEEGFLKFIFPKSVWSHPSAWLDVRYFLFHGLIGHFLVHIFTAGIFVIGMSYTVSLDRLENLVDASNYGLTYRFFIAGLCLIIMTIIVDFVTFYLHYLQHKVPLLWQFHKVHHSSEVMHPLSNFREHPIDNLTYNAVTSLFTGMAMGLILTFIGFKPDEVSIFGIGLVTFLFNITAYQLRHSHIWLKWPGVWSKVFPSPAHHQIHHSRHPDHLDKNFGFILPIWDVLFKTYEMPEDNRDVEFGIVEDSSDLNSCINLYVIPFRDAYRLLKNSKDGKTENPITNQTLVTPEPTSLS